MRSAIRPGERGTVLISSMLLLLVVTLLAAGMFRSLTLAARIAGNVREKQRALHAAVSAQQYAEYWLVNNVAAATDTACSGVVAAASSTTEICSNILSKYVGTGVTTVPWTISSAPVGFTYNPGSDITVGTSGGVNTYYALPEFYISDLGVSALGTNREDYRIDAWSYAGTQSTVAVIESTYEVLYKVKSAMGP